MNPGFKAYLDKQKSKGKKDSKAEDTKEDRKMRRVKGLTAAQETSAALQAGILKRWVRRLLKMIRTKRKMRKKLKVQRLNC
jgi:hypothetical protein